MASTYAENFQNLKQEQVQYLQESVAVPAELQNNVLITSLDKAYNWSRKCATGGGPFKEGYGVVSGIDKYIPVDVYVPGCPPTPEALIYGLLKLHEKVERQSITQVSWYRKDESEFVPVPVLGPDIFDPRQISMIKEHTVVAQPAVAATSSNGADQPAAAAATSGAGTLAGFSPKAMAWVDKAKAMHNAKNS